MTLEETFATVTGDLRQLHDTKGRAYGDSWKKHGEVLGIFANITRKVDRLERLAKLGLTTPEESRIDTVADLAVYSAMYLTWLAEMDSHNFELWSLDWDPNPARAFVGDAGFGLALIVLRKRALHPAFAGRSNTQSAFERIWNMHYSHLEHILISGQPAPGATKVNAVVDLATAAIRWLCLERLARPETYNDWAMQWADSDAPPVPVPLMPLDRYQAENARTRGQFTNSLEQMVFAALEINAEAGELANLVYKEAFQGHSRDAAKLIEEVGDVAWGLACMCDALGTSLELALDNNVQKLRARYPNGFTPEASIARADRTNSAQVYGTLNGERFGTWPNDVKESKRGAIFVPGDKVVLRISDPRHTWDSVHPDWDSAFDEAYTGLVNGENWAILAITDGTRTYEGEAAVRRVMEWGKEQSGRSS